jgi:ABC-type sugar transport system ATPase subunit
VTDSKGLTVEVEAPTLMLRATGIHKRYDAVVALQGAEIELREGEVMGLVGDNGAGKSTLIKTIAGSVIPDSGEILLQARKVTFRKPADALAAGIETVYQDLSLVDPISAVGNIFLGREILRGGAMGRWMQLLDSKEMRRQARDVLNELGARVPSINLPVKDLSGGQRQALAISRALLFGKQIVILDEPTAALGVRESEHVLDMIRQLKKGGSSVIVISHNVEQLMRFADRVTVLRLGRTVGVRTIAETSPAEVVALITGAVGPSAAYTSEDPMTA